MRNLTGLRDASNNLTTFAYDADNLTRGLGGQLRHYAFPDPDLVAQWIGLGPELFRHRLIDDDHRVRAAVIAFRESAAALHRYAENVEVVGRNGKPDIWRERRVGQRLASQAQQIRSKRKRQR